MQLWEQYAPELITDLYELTMAASYHREGMNGRAAFSLFIRDYPSSRNYFVAAGIDHFLDMATSLRFSRDSIDFLARSTPLPRDLLDYLQSFRFTGTIRALPEGSLFFTHEPVLEVVGPLIEAQVLETLAINTIQLETMIAGKAARCVQAAQGRGLIDFAMRRTQGVDASLKTARTSYIAGFAGTSNVLAGKIYSIPTYGTMAHSYVTSFPCELDAFHAFARAFPDNTVLLIDTYDTESGARKAVEVARALQERGKSLKGVRLDSGDMADLSRKVRRILDDAGLNSVAIMVSGNLDEFKIRDLLRAEALIDIFAVGTRMGVSADAPYLDIAYKLVEYEGRPILKLSSGKKTWVGQKQVFRSHDSRGRMKEDVLGFASERIEGAEPLLRTYMENGERIRQPESLETIRSRFAAAMSTFPEPYRDIDAAHHFPVRISPALQALQEQTEAQRRAEIAMGC